MISHPLRRTAFSVSATLALVASNMSAGSAGRPEGASVSVSAPTVTLAARCDLQFPIATVHLRAHNHGNAPSSPTNVRVFDATHELAGSAQLPQLAAHESQSVDVPLSLDAGFDPSKNPAAIVGDHTFDVYLSDPQSPHARLTSSAANVTATIPAAFCAQATALGNPKASSRTKAPGPSLAAGHAFFGSQAQALFGASAAPASIATADPAVPASTPANAARAFAATNITAPAVPLSVATPSPPLSALLKPNLTVVPVGAPQGLRAAGSVGDCETHLHASAGFGGQIGGVVTCQSMIAGGNLVLIWDAPADASVDGYRLYALAGGERGPAVATVSGRARTLANLPPVASGPIPQCYVVTATYASNESPAGPAYCAQEATVTRTLDAMYDRGAWQDREKGGRFADDSIPDGPVVGYNYGADQNVLGDSWRNKIRRYAVAFDVGADALRNKRLVSARLHLTIQSSYGAGNNHSCATTVGSGTEFWWKPDAAPWIEGNFSDSPAQFNDTGPIVSADVTKQVAAIMAGGLNYGFVIRNDNENLGAFMNAQCETVYSNPQLDLVYYDR